MIRKFQFYDSAIKSLIEFFDTLEGRLFQFYDSAIKSVS